MSFTFAEVFHWLGDIVLVGSIISMLLPPIEFFVDYPKFQKYYGLILKLVHFYAALNLRTPMMQRLYGVDISASTPAASGVKNEGKIEDGKK